MIAPLAVIDVSFDRLLRLGELVISWQAMGIALAILVGLVVAALTGGRHAAPASAADLAYVVLAAVPGAVLGGRLMHGLVFWESYQAAPGQLLDPDLGSLSLLGAVLGGLASGGYVAHVLSRSVGQWAAAAAVPLLLALGLGKVAQFAGGSGQGLPFDGPWAVAFVGDGPWVAANAATPAHPSQIYEALWLLVGVPIAARLRAPRPTTRKALVPAMAFALGWFLVGRVVVGFTWRDEAMVGPFNREQGAAFAVLVAMLGLLLVRRLLAGRPGRRQRILASTEYREPRTE